MFATIRRYNVKAGKMDDVIKKVQTGLVPLLGKQKGFQSYRAVDAGNNVAVSVSFYSDRAAADAANTAAAGWVKSNLGDSITPIDVTVGEVTVDAAAAHA